MRERGVSLGRRLVRFVGHFLLTVLPVLCQTYRIDTVAGNGSIGDGGPAPAALFQSVQGVALDGLGNLYISDADDHRIRKVAPSGLIQTLAGTGTAGFEGDGDNADRARLNTPYGVAADHRGNVYVA